MNETKSVFSALFRLNKNDFVRSLLTGLFVAFVGTLYQLVHTAGFNVFAVNWVEVLNSTINLFFIGFVSKLGENTLTDENNVLHLGFAKIKK